MITATCSSDGPPLTISVTVGGIPVYLDNDSLIDLAKGDPNRRECFIHALHNGADLLFSVTNAAELTGPQGKSRDHVRLLLDEVGPHWFPVELDANVVANRELKGLPPSECCVSAEFVKQYRVARWLQLSKDGARIAVFSDEFFKLSAVLDWLEPQRDSIREGVRDLDAALIGRVAGPRAEADSDPAWLDQNFPELKFNASMPATFTYVNLIRGLILDAKAYQLKKGDGCDFCHAVIGGTFASFATLDGQWKRRFMALPQPNTLAKIYYRPELDQLVSDVRAALEDLKAQRR